MWKSFALECNVHTLNKNNIGCKIKPEFLAFNYLNSLLVDMYN
jgi:hypothetical protein